MLLLYQTLYKNFPRIIIFYPQNYTVNWVFYNCFGEFK